MWKKFPSVFTKIVKVSLIHRTSDLTSLLVMEKITPFRERRHQLIDTIPCRDKRDQLVDFLPRWELHKNKSSLRLSRFLSTIFHTHCHTHCWTSLEHILSLHVMFALGNFRAIKNDVASVWNYKIYTSTKLGAGRQLWLF